MLLNLKMFLSFKLRPMEEQDLAITLVMRNEPEVLKNAITSNVISAAEHDAMFRYNNAVKLVFEINGQLAGVISVSRDPDDSTGEWSFYMGKEFRGKGYSEIMLKSVLLYISKEEGYTGVRATVLKHNAVSKHLHYKLGFEHTGDKNNMHEYWLSL
jgi:RimJ/RimL family protein N-acetyltransferase